MLVILPVTKADSELAVKLAHWIVTLGGAANHHLLVSGTKQSKVAAEEVLNILQGTFSSTHLFIPEEEHELGWPSSANFMFARTSGYAYCAGSRSPFYWFEADNTPLKPTWLDDLETEYNLAQKPFMGTLEDSIVYDPVTRKVLKKDGQHMNGSGIYPANFIQNSLLFDTIHTHQDGQPWDLYLRWEMTGKVHDSKQMVNNWRSENYTRTSDGPIASVATDPRHPSKYVTDAVAVVHGCKDGSLIDLLIKERAPKPKKK